MDGIENGIIATYLPTRQILKSRYVVIMYYNIEPLSPDGERAKSLGKSVCGEKGGHVTTLL